MPTFELTDVNGGVYQIDAPNERAAFDAFSKAMGGDAPVTAPTAGSSLAGVGKSLGVGAAEGVIGLAGLPGDIGSLVGSGVDYAGSKLGVDPGSVQKFKDVAKAGLSATPAGIFAAPGSQDIQSEIEKLTGKFYKPQGAPEELAQKIGQFLPGMIGGPGGMATRFATQVAAPAIASEIGKNVAGPYGEVAGALVGAGGGVLAERRLREMVDASRRAAQANPSADAIIKKAKEQFKSAEDMNLVVAPEFATEAAAKMRADLRGFDPEAQAAVFKAADRLAGLAPPPAPLRSAASVAVPAAPAVANTTAAAPPSLLEFIASKGGLKPDAELEAIGLATGHRTQIPGQRGFFSVVSNRGGNIDRIREAAEEAGYLRGQNGATSTPRDLLDAIDAELRGQKRFPAGYEGSRTKRESLLMSEREQAAYDAHIRKFEDALEDAGHGKISPDVKSRAINLMEREGMSADDAVESALLQLDQEDAAVGAVARAPQPPPVPGAFVHGFPPDMARGVAMNDVELIRKQLTTLKTSPDASVREAARKAIKSLQESQTSLNSAQVINGEAGSYTRTMREAIANYAAGKRSNTVMGKVALGELNAATAGSGANEDNALRQAIKQLARPVNNDITPKWKRLGFSDAEGAAIERAARGTAGGNAARYLGKFAPTGVVSGAGALGLGSLFGGPVGAVALPAAGYLAKKIGDMSTKRAVAALDELVRSRAPLARQVAAQLPPRIVQELPAKTKLLLGAVAARPIVSPQPVPAGSQ